MLTAYKNIKSDPEYYIKAFMVEYLAITDFEKLDELYNVFINSSYQLFSSEIHNYLEYLEKERAEKIEVVFNELLSFINQEINIDILIEYLKNMGDIEFVDKKSNQLVTLKIISDDNIFCYLLLGNRVILFDNYKIYNTKIKKYISNNQENSIVYIYENERLLGYLYYHNIPLETEHIVKNGLIDINEVILKSYDDDRIKEFVKDKFTYYIRKFSKIKLSDEFDYKSTKNVLISTLNDIDIPLAKEFVLNFFEYLFKVRTQANITSLDYFSISFYEIELVFDSITDVLIELRSEFEKYNVMKQSYEDIKNDSAKRLITGYIE